MQSNKLWRFAGDNPTSVWPNLGADTTRPRAATMTWPRDSASILGRLMQAMLAGGSTWVVAVVLFLSLGTFGFAQSDPPVVTDQTLGGTGGKFENVELSNGGVNLSIHLLKIKGRGLDFE